MEHVLLYGLNSDELPRPILVTDAGAIVTSGGGGGGGVTDHGALTGLADDDHTQYALVSGARAFTGAVTVGTVNKLTITPATAGNPVTIGVTGPDPSIDIWMLPKTTTLSGDEGRVIVSMDGTVKTLNDQLATLGLFVVGEDVNYAAISLSSASTSSSKNSIFFNASRGSLAVPTAVQNGDYIGNLAFSGFDGDDFYQFGAYVSIVVDGAVSSGIVPMGFEFYTGNGTSTPLAMTISSTGLVTALLGLTVVGGITGALTGNASTATLAATATALATARNINGTSFNGTADITVTAAAGTLTGTTLNATVVTSSLTSVGTLASLAITGGIVWAGDATLRRLGAGSMRWGAADSASPVSYTLTGGENSRGGTDSNVAGGSLVIRSGLGTGTGVVTNITLQTATVAASGATQQTYGTRVAITSAAVVLSTVLGFDFNGTAAAPAIYIQNTGYGFSQISGVVATVAAGAAIFGVSATEVRVKSSVAFGWSSSDPTTNGNDTSFTRAAAGVARITGSFAIGAALPGTSGVGVLAILNGTKPSTSPADTLQIYAVDIAAGRSTLGIRTEEAVAADIALASTVSLTIEVNGALYKWGLTAV